MCRFILLTLTLLLSSTGHSQNLGDISYDIDVTLDDVRHTLIGHIAISFTNETGRSLDSICVLLYPNAYSSDQSAFAKQRLEFGYTDFHFAPQEDRGSIDSLQFVSGGVPLDYAFDDQHPDIGWVKLNAPLGHGQSIVISTSFRVKVPESFSRLGHIGDSYQVTQWYPKLAMYDTNGWHAIPYLDSGEFYSEFASYKVLIELPENYVVGATGTLLDQGEVQWLDSLATAQNKPTSSFPPSSQRHKQISYAAEDVHDFAWFADKRYAVRKDSIEMSGSKVCVYAMYTAASAVAWDSATHYLKDALRFMSSTVGAYPYGHMTAVESPLSGGAGMEYPMITLIGYESSGFSLDRVLFHEVTHNWFQGMLATNERAHAWMDEGMTSYLEDRYIMQKYGTLRDDYLLHLTARPNSYRDPQAVMQYLSRNDRLQAPAVSSAEYAEFNHLFSAYVKPALGFSMLEHYVGREVFDQALKEYFERWKFSHPSPEDLQESLERSTGENLTWLFNDILGAKDLPDYGFGQVDPYVGTVELRQFGQRSTPVEIVGLSGEDTVSRAWYDVVSRDTTVVFDIDGCDRLLLFDPLYSLDENPGNNVAYLGNRGVTKRKLKITMFSGVREPGYTMINVFPFAGWNEYDKALFGFNISNYYWPAPDFEYSLTPMYSVGTNSFAGIADLKYKLFVRKEHDQGLKKIEFKFNFRSFHFNMDEHYDFSDRYIKYAPAVSFQFTPSRVTRKISHELSYRFVRIQQRYGVGIDFDNRVWDRQVRSYNINEAVYVFRQRKTVMPRKLTVMAQQGKGFLRLSTEIVQEIQYNERGKAVYVRAFVGSLPYYDNPEVIADFALSGTADLGIFARDFTYDQYLLGRSELEGVLSQQVYTRDAAFQNASVGGLSDRWMAGVGINVDIPGPVPIQLYSKAAVGNGSEDVQFSFTSGIALIGLRDALELYIPLYENSTVTDDELYGDRSFWQRITLMINFNRLTPGHIRDEWLAY